MNFNHRNYICYIYFLFSLIQKIIGHDCDILESAKARYEQIIRKFVSLKMRGYRTVDNNTVDNKHSPRRLNSWREDPLFHEYLESIQINLKKPCEIEPYLDMDESCMYLSLNKCRQINKKNRILFCSR